MFQLYIYICIYIVHVSFRFSSFTIKGKLFQLVSKNIVFDLRVEKGPSFRGVASTLLIFFLILLYLRCSENKEGIAVTQISQSTSVCLLSFFLSFFFYIFYFYFFFGSCLQQLAGSGCQQRAVWCGLLINSETSQAHSLQSYLNNTEKLVFYSINITDFTSILLTDTQIS